MMGGGGPQEPSYSFVPQTTPNGCSRATSNQLSSPPLGFQGLFQDCSTVSGTSLERPEPQPWG